MPLIDLLCLHSERQLFCVALLGCPGILPPPLFILLIFCASQEPELPAGKHTGGAAALPGVKGPLLVRSKSKLQLSAAADDQTKPEAVEQRLSSQVVQHRHLPPKKAEAVNAGRRRSADDPKDPDPLPRKSKSEDEEAAGDAMVQKQKSQQLERGPAASKAGSAHKGSARDPKHTQAAHGLEGGDASKAKGSKGGRPSADAPEEPQPGPAELPDEGPGGITEAMESIAIFAVEEWRKLRLAIRSVPVASSQSMLGLSLSHQASPPPPKQRGMHLVSWTPFPLRSLQDASFPSGPDPFPVTPCHGVHLSF